MARTLDNYTRIHRWLTVNRVDIDELDGLSMLLFNVEWLYVDDEDKDIHLLTVYAKMKGLKGP